MPNISGMSSISASLGGILNPNKGVLEGATFGGGKKGDGEGGVGKRNLESGRQVRREESESESESESEGEGEGRYDEEEEGPRTRTNTNRSIGGGGGVQNGESSEIGRESMDLRIEQGQLLSFSLSFLD